MFEENNKATEYHEEVVAHSQQLEEVITNVCSELPELQILARENLGEKLQMTTTVKESKAKVGKVRFELNI